MLNVNTIKLAGTKSVSRSLLIAKKYSPEVLTAVGVVGVVASAVLASKATLKLEATVEDITNDINFNKNRRLVEGHEDYTDTEYQKDMARAYVQATKEIGKLYGPSVTLGLASIGCIVGAHGIMRKRNVALAAAYKAVETSFAEYRKRVVEELGEDQESDIRRGVREEEVVQDGKKTIIKTVDARGISQYARFFDELSTSWKDTAEYNLMFLRTQQNHANDMLIARGHVFLNEVYDMLGIPRTKAGSVVGWVVSKEGDNFVDFGMYDLKNEKAREFVNGIEKAILLDFNVDGVVYDKLP